MITKKRQPVSGKKALAVAVRDGLWCACCKTVEDLTVDHLVPLDRGGTSDISNLGILCGSCNSSKGNGLYCKMHVAAHV